jgi:hypothetical protein
MVRFMTSVPSKVSLVLGLDPDSLVVLFTYIGVPCYSPPCLDDAPACCPSSAQVCPREVDKGDSH